MYIILIKKRIERNNLDLFLFNSFDQIFYLDIYIVIFPFPLNLLTIFADTTLFPQN